MMKKDNLGQDMLLLGPPGAGSIYRYRLARQYAALTRRSVEVLTLSQDVTESDLKQRRELVNSEQGDLDVVFVDQAPVRAAVNGHLLILDGLEAAERNVLPTLNNLLEHREMHLEDGRFLISPHRYSHGSSNPKLIPVHPDFRVIALGVPSPPFPGRSLDPPLRSRFQIRRIDHPNPSQFHDLDGSDASLVSFVGAMTERSAATSTSSDTNARILLFPFNSLESMSDVRVNFPSQDRYTLLLRAYPVAQDDLSNTRLGCKSSRKSFQQAFTELGIERNSSTNYNLSEIVREDSQDGEFKAIAKFQVSDSEIEPNSLRILLPCGGNEINEPAPGFFETENTQKALTEMFQEHAAGRDLLLLASKGEGKNAMASQFASLLGYDVHLFSMYKEMTSQELLLRRSTNAETGETQWEKSPLLTAAQSGSICVLDGIDKLSSTTLANLRTLTTDRELFLPDGRHLADHKCGDSSIHPSFRIIALASPNSETPFLTEEVMSMFSTIIIPRPMDDSVRELLSYWNPHAEAAIDILINLRGLLTEAVARDCGVQPLSLRNMIQIVRRISSPSTSIYEAVSSVLVVDLLPLAQKAALDSILADIGIVNNTSISARDSDTYSQILLEDGTVSFDDFEMEQGKPNRPEMVPSPEFFVDTASHIRCLQSLLRDWKNGERAFLLLGNQGTGKNMIADQLCHICQWQREYIQLHRDSTIGQLTLSPSLENGKITWKDSPLVTAVSQGCVLVVDEADKAPVEVVSILKGLVEDGELLLADGRRISRHRAGDGIIQMHPDFTLLVLANRPGFPFLGNDFVQELSDCLSVRVISNPDFESEVKLLKSYAPTIDEQILKNIAGAFSDLRLLAEDGDISYPYSTREAVGVVKHLEKYPDDDVVSALHNVLDFDSFDDHVYAMLGRVFQRHGFDMTEYQRFNLAFERVESNQKQRLEIELLGERRTDGYSEFPPELREPKLGKWDDKNEAHVGGNQWAGGTGGSDTAGLGGRGGPYRLDRGHKVHQVSDEAKSQVTEEAARAAKAMAEKALKERLQEIEMSDSEWKLYQRFVDPIRGEVSNFRGLLNNVQAKTAERGWIKRQTHGELDDSRLVDGVTGEKLIYKRRGTVDNTAPSHRPKRLRFVFDCSGSMYRFNGYDQRLSRSLEAAALVMEGFDNLQNRFEYSLVGHSGDSHCIPFVESGRPPANEKERIRILQNMLAHSQYCQSGDNTLEAIQQAIFDVSTGSRGQSHDEDPDEESIVIGISDANLYRYGIHPSELGRILVDGEEQNVKAYAIFVASFGEEADDIKRSLPPGRGHICYETSDLPRVMRSILTSQLGG